MPRYVATVHLDRTYHRFMHAPSVDVTRDEFIQSCRIAALPDPDPIDWIIGPATPVSIEASEAPDDKGRWTAVLRSTVGGLLPMAVHAANPTEAEAIALRDSTEWRDDVFGSSGFGGWHHHAAAITVSSVRRDDGPVRARRSFDVDVERVIAPDLSLHPLHLDQAFEFMRWMVSTSANYETRCSYHTQTVHHLLKGSSTRFDEKIGLVTSEADLKSRLIAGVLGQAYGIYRQWREEHGIHPTATLTIAALHHGPNGNRFATPRGPGFPSLMEAFADAKGMRMARSLNHCHPKAVVIQEIGVAVRADGYAFRMRYGFGGPSDSSWSHDLAITRGGEPFSETAERALDRLRVLVPSYVVQRDERRRQPWPTKIAA